MIEFFLKRKVLTNLITLFLIVLGTYYFFTMKREAFPDVDFDIVTITTPFPGASPKEVETLLTIPIEKELRGTNGVDRVESFSLEDRSLIIIRLEENLTRREADKTIHDIQQAVTRVEDFPEDAKRPLVKELTSDRPLITISVAGGTTEARDRAADEIRDALEMIEGVSKVELEGDLEREIWVEANADQLAAYRLSLAEIMQSLKSKSLEISAGSVETEHQEMWVRILGGMENAEDIERMILRGNDERSFVRIGDVAKVTERFEEPRVITKTNGLPSVNLMVRKHRSGDSIRLAEAVKKLAREWEPKLQEKEISLILSDDLSFFIKRRLNVMKNNMIQGGFLILLSLFLFLDWRLALIAAFGVPISFATALAVGVPMGLTINLLSLIAFIIVLGMLDDDSVVVAENIYRHLEMGKNPYAACVDGAKEVILPVLGSVATSSFAFLPFALMSGIMGKFLVMIPVVVILSFIASIFEAFYILPGHVLDLFPYGKPVGATAGRWYAKVLHFYETILTWSLRHRYKFGVILAGVLIGTGVLVKARVDFILFPAGLIDQFFVQVEMPESTGLEATEKTFRAVEEEINKIPRDQLESMTATIGMTGFEQTIRRGTHLAQARLFLTPQETRERKTDAMIDELRGKLKNIPGVKKIAFDKLKPGPPVGKAVQVKVSGKEIEVARSLAQKIKEELQRIDGVVDILDSTEGGKLQVNVRVIDEEAAFAGLNTNLISQNLLYAIGGIEAAKIRRPDEEVKVRLRLQEEERKKPRTLEKLYAFNANGKPVILGNVVSIQKERGLPYLERYNYRPSVTVTADVQENVTTSRKANAELIERLEKLKKEHPGYRFIFGGEEEETRKSLRSLFRAFGVTMLLDFVILAALFKSYVRPLLILLTVPIGMLGVAYALILHGAPASFMALLGVVAMTGVVINNAIVLVDFIIRKREEGKDAETAAIHASVTRLRPIWASALTTLVGLFPTAYGFGGYEPFVKPMALAMAWGLLFAMPLTLFLIPSAYVVLEDCREWFNRIFLNPNHSAGCVNPLDCARDRRDERDGLFFETKK